MYLFFDTETTGLPRDRKAKRTDLANWPRLVQLAYLVYDKSGNRISAAEAIIKPEGFTIPDDAARVHGITTARAEKEGEDLREVLQNFHIEVEKTVFLIAHNMWFDENVVGAEFLRNQISDILPKKRKICTMISATDFCALPGPDGFRWPKLVDLHSKLFGEGFESAHSAGADIAATAKCFWELKRQGIIKV